MSADNYWYISTEENRFVASMGFASDTFPPKPRPHDRRFGRWDSLVRYLNDNATEYGVQFTDEAAELRNDLASAEYSEKRSNDEGDEE